MENGNWENRFDSDKGKYENLEINRMRKLERVLRNLIII